MEALQPLRHRSPSPLRPKSHGGGLKPHAAGPTSRSKSGRENAPPPLFHPHVQIDCRSESSPSFSSKSKKKATPAPLQAESAGGAQLDPSPAKPSDSSAVKVVVRVRPEQQRDGNLDVMKLSTDSLSVGGRSFAFDSVLGPKSTQEEVFKLVGVPVVKNSLAGYNTSILSYGESGSGKTYTMWGPPSAMIDGSLANGGQGIVPRIFHMLFSEIDKKQESMEERQINYLVRCSFLEIYNERVNDLLDPTQKDLQIKDDSRNGFYVENLTDEYVSTVEDVTQLLVKGLANRKVGATHMNSRSSRSHIIFTCVVESWCKRSAATCFSSSWSSRMNFIDLAGADRGTLDGVGKQAVKEARYIKKSLSKLGKLVNVLGNTAIYEEQKVPNGNSCLTRLLMDTLGGNAKVTVICSVSPDTSCRASSVSTLRFGERARNIQNNAMINEISEDDVNGLSDQIRQLKEELMRAQLEGGNLGSTTGGLFRGRNARDNLNFLRVSINRSLILPSIDLDSEEEIDLDEKDVKELCTKLGNLNSTADDKPTNISDTSTISSLSDCGVDVSCLSEQNGSEVEHPTDLSTDGLDNGNASTASISVQSNNSLRKSRLSVSPCRQSQVLQEPILCSSPKFSNDLKKHIASQDGRCESPKSSPLIESIKKSEPLRASLQLGKTNSTESLAASLQKGLQIIDYHQKSSSARSFASLSFEHLANISNQKEEKADVGMQAYNEASTFLCSACQKIANANECKSVQRSTDLQIIPVSSTGNVEISEAQTLEDNKHVITSTKREMELETLCAQQAETINRLTCLVDQHAMEKDQSSSKEQMSEGGCMITQCDPEKESLLLEIQSLKEKLKSFEESAEPVSLLEQIRNGGCTPDEASEDFEKERERWMESESKWICMTDELRIDLDTHRRIAEKKDIELNQEKKCRIELDDALQRAILGHAKFVEHYAELQEKYDDLLLRHRKVMEGIAEVKKAAVKAGAKGSGSAFATALAAELSTLRIDREKERAYLKEQNRRLRIQLRDTAEAVHAAGELLVRLREAEESASRAEEKCAMAQQETEKMKKQMEKQKRKHAMELVTMKHFLAESRLPESALEPFYVHETEENEGDKRAPAISEDDQSWRAAFQPSYE